MQIERTPTVLIVDDDDITRMMAKGFLQQAGFGVEEARDGVDALSRFPGVGPDIVLLDVEMPNLNGYETCARLRALPEGRQLPILMLTGLDDETSIDLAYEAGATDFATKPINWPLLCRRVRYLLKASAILGQLKRSQAGLASAQRLAGLGSWEWHVERDVVVTSEHLRHIWDLPSHDAASPLPEFLRRVHPRDLERVKRGIDAARRAHGGVDIDHRIVTADGEVRHVRQQLESERDATGRAICLRAAVQDVTERHRAETEIRRLAYFDSLTSLPNRELFRRRLDSALATAAREGRSLAVMFLDIDDFKRVNDTLGHACGDLLLAEVARRLSESVRAGDTVLDGNGEEEEEDEVGQVVARMSGDEFTVLLSGLSDGDAAAGVAERILENVSRPFHLGGNDVFTTPSIGIATYPDHGESGEELLKKADMAMYRAKREGKNLYRYYHEAMNIDVQRRYLLEAHLRRALERDELSLHYQPQMNLASGELDAVEALLRWKNPELGQVSPADFIPLAEETGLILPIGEWVLRTACRQACLWHERGRLLTRVAVNISVMQFVQPEFPALLARILEESGLDPSKLELEITESVLAIDTKGAVEMLRRLKELGVQLSIDDFGTGYSSLSQLRHFPIDRLKIDQSFVRGITENSRDAAITQAVLAMADSMDLQVVAEGVETREQMRYLESKSCDEIQGYWLSHPLPPDEVESLLGAACPAPESRRAGARR